MSAARGAASAGGTGGGADEHAASASAAIAAIPIVVKPNPILVSRIRNSGKIKSIEVNFAQINFKQINFKLVGCPLSSSRAARIRPRFLMRDFRRCRLGALRRGPQRRDCDRRRMRRQPPVNRQSLVRDIRHHPLTGNDPELVCAGCEIRNRIRAVGIGDSFACIDVRRRLQNRNRDARNRLAAAVQNSANQIGARRRPSDRQNGRYRCDQDRCNICPRCRRFLPSLPGFRISYTDVPFQQARVRHPLRKPFHQRLQGLH